MKKGDCGVEAEEKENLRWCIKELLFMNEKYDNFKQMQSKQNIVRKFETYYQKCLEQRRRNKSGELGSSLVEMANEKQKSIMKMQAEKNQTKSGFKKVKTKQPKFRNINSDFTSLNIVSFLDKNVIFLVFLINF